jgi:hypothetical protein
MSQIDGMAAMFSVRPWLHTFGEWITYTPSGQQGRSVRAVVRRRPMEPRGPLSQKLEYAMELYISREDVPRVEVHADSVSLRRLPGDTAETVYQVVRKLGSDGGMWYLGLN